MVLIALEEAGLAENTIVIYISDHGDWLGDHGLILKGPMHYEGLLQVPMIVRGPGIPEGKTVDEPVSTLDLGPTFCDYAGTEPLLDQHGESLGVTAHPRRGGSQFAHRPYENTQDDYRSQFRCRRTL